MDQIFSHTSSYECRIRIQDENSGSVSGKKRSGSVSGSATLFLPRDEKSDIGLKRWSTGAGWVKRWLPELLWQRACCVDVWPLCMSGQEVHSLGQGQPAQGRLFQTVLSHVARYKILRKWLPAFSKTICAYLCRVLCDIKTWLMCPKLQVL